MGLRKSFAVTPTVAAVPVPPPLRAPFGWPVIALGAGSPVMLTWPKNSASAGEGGWLRLATAVDDREDRIMTVRVTDSGELLGEIQLRWTPSLTPSQLRLTAAQFAAAQRGGVSLTVPQKNRPLWLFGSELPAQARAWAPHLLLDEAAGERPADPAAAFFAALASPASLQPFGWMEGCVLDGLYDLRERTREPRFHRALQIHLDAFLPEGGKLVYENPRGEAADSTIITIEATLPFALFAKIDPVHPLLGLATDFWRAHTTKSGVIQDGETLSAEGAYTVAYPMAVLAAQRGDGDLARLAAEQLRVRQRRLWHDGALWLRHTDRDQRTFRNWARGVAWYFLGLVRATEALHAFMDTAEFEAEVRTTAKFVRALQRADGLWSCFLDDVAAASDTSGSAGIAAALARGARAGWLDEADHALAARTWSALLGHLTPDGLLGGAAPANRGGESLQRSAHRVLSPMGMGLMGQLAAALPDGAINFAQLLSSSTHDKTRLPE
jgi:rhamnogalacturonyl hydrolase YesR